MKSFSQFLAEVRGSFDADPGSKEYQKALEKERTKKEEEKRAIQQRNADAARHAFRTRGIPFSDAKGSGHIRNGVKYYDT